MSQAPGVEPSDVSVYKIPTNFSESESPEWTDRTMVVVEVYAPYHSSIGYTLADSSMDQLIKDKLAAARVGLEREFKRADAQPDV